MNGVAFPMRYIVAGCLQKLRSWTVWHFQCDTLLLVASVSCTDTHSVFVNDPVADRCIL